MFSMAEASRSGQSSAAVISSCSQLDVNNVSDVGGRKSTSAVPTSNNNMEKQHSVDEEVKCRVTDITSSADKQCSALSLKAPQIKVIPTVCHCHLLCLLACV